MSKSNNNHRIVTVQESADSGCAQGVVDNAVQLYIRMLDGIINRRLSAAEQLPYFLTTPLTPPLIKAAISTRVRNGLTPFLVVAR